MNECSIKKVFKNKQSPSPAFRKILMRNYVKTNQKTKAKPNFILILEM